MEDSPTDQYGKMNNSVNIAGEISYLFLKHWIPTSSYAKAKFKVEYIHKCKKKQKTLKLLKENILQLWVKEIYLK